jgi:cytoskeleton protein RodZ
VSDLKDGMDGIGPVAGLGAGGTPGQVLRGAREARKLSLEDVAQHLKYAPRQIEALERDDYLQLPAATVVRGMVRSYAKLLELAPEPLLQSVNQHLAPSSAVPVGTRDTRGMAVPFPTRPAGTHRGWWIFSLIVAIGVVAVLVDWSALRDAVVRTLGPFMPAVSAPERPAASSETPAPATPTASRDGAATPITLAPTSADQAATPSAATQPAQSSAAPAPAAPATAAAGGVAPAVAAITPPGAAATAAADGAPTRRIELQFRKDSWVEARTADNRVLMNQLNPGGTTRTLDVAGEVRLAIGAADGVTLLFDGKPVDLAPLIQLGVARVTLK